jgi:hypothetical protein
VLANSGEPVAPDVNSKKPVLADTESWPESAAPEALLGLRSLNTHPAQRLT